MLSEDKNFYTMTEVELWQHYCGFLDLSVDDFMDAQRGLLMDEVELVADSTLGKKIMGNQKPKSVDEFRHMVPITTYDDYEPYLSEQREDVLATKPRGWVHSSGKGGRFKWVPLNSEFIAKTVKCFMAGFIFASTDKKGKVNIAPGCRFILLLPPKPYASGFFFEEMVQSYFSLRPFPPLEASNIEVKERIELGFQMALREGVDLIGSVASVLVRMGEQLSEQAHTMQISRSMFDPRIMCRLLRAWLTSKIQKRTILPKDLWPSKGIMTGGMDCAIYKDDIAHFWGCKPFEMYGCTESGMVATQAWNRKTMTFRPDIAFLEFIPHDERSNQQDTPDYQPSTVLLDEVKEGKLYEVVFTQFFGMPLLRYRTNDIVKITALQDEETGIDLPQMVFHRRVGEIINLGGLTTLDEKSIWQAIASSGIKYSEWAACKEYDRNRTFLRLYLELKEEREVADVESIIDERLKIVDTDYKDIESYLGTRPLRITLLLPGTFQRYMEEKTKEGADLAQLKPAHINAPEATIQRLLQLSRAVNEL